MYYFYEGRTIKGIGLVGWALIVQFIAVIAMGVTQAALGLVFGTVVQNPTLLFGPILAALAALCGIVLAELGVAIVFLIGFFQIHAGRHEYGLEQARSIDRALVFLIIYIVLGAVSVVYSASSSMFPSLTGQTGIPQVSGSLVLGPLGALFAGLTLEHSVRSVADPALKSRLRTGLILGVVGAAVGPSLTLLATAGGALTVGSIASALIASAVAGQGISALSLLLFWLAYQETRQALEAGRPAPVLPRIQQLYPWLYYPVYPYPPSTPQSPQTPRP